MAASVPALRSPSPAYPDHLAMTSKAAKPQPVVHIEPEREARRAWLLAGNLAYLQSLEAVGLDGLASALVDKIADGLARTPTCTSHVVTATELPAHERGRSPEDLKRLDILNRRIAKPLPKGDKKAEGEHDENVAERDALERRTAVVADGRWAQAAVAETLALADARGAQIETERSGIARIIDTDVLFNLANAGHLTADQLETGREVRDLYDSRAQDAGAMEYTGMPGSAHDHEKFVGTRFTRAKASEFIGRIERAVAIHCSAEPVCLVALRAVCERGWPMISMGAGRAFERNCKALARALDVADDVLRRRL